jgi:hypothetical protein
MYIPFLDGIVNLSIKVVSRSELVVCQQVLLDSLATGTSAIFESDNSGYVTTGQKGNE